MKRYRPIGLKLSPVTVWVLCGLYLLFSVGIIKATHFCMGREASVAYFTSEVKKCACSGSIEEAEGCCNDEHDLLKLEDSQKTFSSFVLPLPDLTPLGDIYTPYVTSKIDPAGAFAAFSAESPPLRKVLYKIHCSFVFYEDSSVA
jgi:hypothetical protein